MRLIQCLTVATTPPKRFEIGKEYNGRIVTEIKDTSCEWENSIDFMYDIKDKDGKPIARIENCPVILEFIEIPEEDLHDDFKKEARLK